MHQESKPTLEAPLKTTEPEARAWFWAVLVAAVIFFESSHGDLAAPSISGFDKVAHFMVYGLLGTLWARLSWVIKLRPLGAFTAVVFASLYGISDEFHQSFTPGRSVEVADWIADTLGAGLAVFLHQRWTWYREFLEGPVLPRGRSGVVADRKTLSKSAS